MITEYLGDGLYVEYNGDSFRLYTPRDDGVHQVYLDPDVLDAFLDFVKGVVDAERKGAKR